MSILLDDGEQSSNKITLQKSLSSDSDASGYVSDEDESLTLRVCSEANQGMRRYMEDELSINIGTETEREAFLAVYDGHGGKDAPCFARDHLYDNIKKQPKFYSENSEDVKAAIREGFLQTHQDMVTAVESWPKRKDGHNSTSGTTVTVAIIRGRKLYVAHVGDSAAVLGEKSKNEYLANEITEDHKPESPKEMQRIREAGGRVAQITIPRVVWKRQRLDTQPPQFEYVPFLAVSRALGDLWSYNSDWDTYVVSPDPDIYVTDLTSKHKFIILASDGVWGVMNGQKAVDIITAHELDSRKKPDKRNCAKELVQKTLGLWCSKRTRADNVTAIVAFFDNDFASEEYESDTSDDMEPVLDAADIVEEEEEDTPVDTDSNSKLPETNPSLVRKLAFRRFDSNEGKLTVTTVTKAKFSPTSPCSPVGNHSANQASSAVLECPAEPLIFNTDEKEKGLKRKSSDLEDCEESSAAEPDSKKMKSTSLPPISTISPTKESVAEEKSSNIITKLSHESIKGLQFDEDLGFADDEADVKKCLSSVSSATIESSE